MAMQFIPQPGARQAGLLSIHELRKVIQNYTILHLLHAQKALIWHTAYIIILKLEHVDYICKSEPLKIDRSELAKKGTIKIKLGSCYSSLANVQSGGRKPALCSQAVASSSILFISQHNITVEPVHRGHCVRRLATSLLLHPLTQFKLKVAKLHTSSLKQPLIIGLQVSVIDRFHCICIASDIFIIIINRRLKSQYSIISDHACTGRGDRW